MFLSSGAAYKRSPTAHCSPVLWLCREEVPLPTTCALEEPQCPLLLGSVSKHKSNPTAHRPEAVWQCTERIPPPTALRQRGTV